MMRLRTTAPKRTHASLNASRQTAIQSQHRPTPFKPSPNGPFRSPISQRWYCIAKNLVLSALGEIELNLNCVVVFVLFYFLCDFVESHPQRLTLNWKAQPRGNCCS